MRCHSVYVCRHNVRLDAIDRDRLWRCSVSYRVDECEQLPGPVRLTHRRKSHHRPNGAMGVLSAIFPNTGYVSFDIAWIELRLVEGGSSN